MSKKQKDRLDRLIPDGVPKYIRCYDNGGETADRYMVCYTRYSERYENYGSVHYHRDMSGAPFHPQGVGIWGENRGQQIDVNDWGFAPALGRKNHLGTRIPFERLPDDCKRLVIQDYKEIWNL